MNLLARLHKAEMELSTSAGPNSQHDPTKDLVVGHTARLGGQT